MNRTLKVSVILPVYNGEGYVGDAIRSVLVQTFRDFELIVIDDGSTDLTCEILAGFADPRMRVIRQRRNLGLVSALNIGIAQSRGELIARMDADDICHPRRLEKQAAYLEAHPGISICASWFRTFGFRSGRVRSPVNPDHIRARMFFGWAMAHPTLVIRRRFLEEHSLAYSEDFRNCEDYDFLARAAELGALAAIPEFLLHYRLHGGQVTVKGKEEMNAQANRVRLRQLRKLMGQLTTAQEDFHLDLFAGLPGEVGLTAAGNWLLRLDRANLETGLYHAGYFRRGLEDVWHQTHSAQTAPAGIATLQSYWKSPLRSLFGIGFGKHARLAAKAFLRPRSGYGPARDATARYCVAAEPGRED